MRYLILMSMFVSAVAEARARGGSFGGRSFSRPSYSRPVSRPAPKPAPQPRRSSNTGALITGAVVGATAAHILSSDRAEADDLDQIPCAFGFEREGNHCEAYD